jgi:hypothetical protein
MQEVGEKLARSPQDVCMTFEEVCKKFMRSLQEVCKKFVRSL